MISLLNKEDYNKIVDLGSMYDKDFATKYLNDYYKIYVYQEDEILGFIITEDTVDDNSIILLYVDKDYRRNGIGSKLIEYYTNIANKRILLEVSANNIPAISLYKKYGFLTINTRKNYYKDGSDAIVMEKRINNE